MLWYHSTICAQCHMYVEKFQKEMSRWSFEQTDVCWKRILLINNMFLKPIHKIFLGYIIKILRYAIRMWHFGWLVLLAPSPCSNLSNNWFSLNLLKLAVNANISFRVMRHTNTTSCLLSILFHILFGWRIMNWKEKKN